MKRAQRAVRAFFAGTFRIGLAAAFRAFPTALATGSSSGARAIFWPSHFRPHQHRPSEFMMHAMLPQDLGSSGIVNTLFLISDMHNLHNRLTAYRNCEHSRPAVSA